MQFFIPKNRPLVRKALRLADRDDLIGTGKNCLVPSEAAERAMNEKRSAAGSAASNTNRKGNSASKRRVLPKDNRGKKL